MVTAKDQFEVNIGQYTNSLVFCTQSARMVEFLIRVKHRRGVSSIQLLKDYIVKLINANRTETGVGWGSCWHETTFMTKYCIESKRSCWKSE